MKEILTLCRVLVITAIPVAFIYYLVWQSISFANLNREVKKLTQKKEELFKKNYDLKSRIASSTSIERIDEIYKKSNKKTPSYSGNQSITLTLPKDKTQDFKKQ